MAMRVLLDLVGRVELSVQRRSDGAPSHAVLLGHIAELKLAASVRLDPMEVDVRSGLICLVGPPTRAVGDVLAARLAPAR